MACGRTVDQGLSVFDRTGLWMNLRLLHGLDLDEFLVGSKHAYTVVSELMRERQWDALGELMQPTCLEAMQELGPSIARIPADADDSISIYSAVLTSAHVLEPCSREGIAPGTAHLDVKFVSLQAPTLHDLQLGAVDSALGEPRLQESTWTFEGVTEGSGDVDWRVRDISWSVWEVQQRRQQQQQHF